MTEDRSNDQAARAEEETLPALGQPAGHPDDTSMEQPEIAGEHEDTAVDKSITAGTDSDREPESPHHWAGMDS